MAKGYVYILTLPKFKTEGVQGVFVDDTAEQSSQTTQKTTQKMSDLQKAIFDYISLHPETSRKVMVQAIGGITEDGIKYNLRVLQEKGLIKHVGPDKGGHWEIIK